MRANIFVQYSTHKKAGKTFFECILVWEDDTGTCKLEISFVLLRSDVGPRQSAGNPVFIFGLVPLSIKWFETLILLLWFNICAVNNKFRRASVRVEEVPLHVSVTFCFQTSYLKVLCFCHIIEVFTFFFIKYACISMCFVKLTLWLIDFRSVDQFHIYTVIINMFYLQGI